MLRWICAWTRFQLFLFDFESPNPGRGIYFRLMLVMFNCVWQKVRFSQSRSPQPAAVQPWALFYWFSRFFSRFRYPPPPVNEKPFSIPPFGLRLGPRRFQLWQQSCSVPKSPRSFTAHHTHLFSNPPVRSQKNGEHTWLWQGTRRSFPWQSRHLLLSWIRA